MSTTDKSHKDIHVLAADKHRFAGDELAALLDGIAARQAAIARRGRTR